MSIRQSAVPQEVEMNQLSITKQKNKAMLPAISIQPELFQQLNPFKNLQKNYTIDYQENNNTLIIKGEFTSKSSELALSRCQHIIEQHLAHHPEMHLFIYFKKYDLVNTHAWVKCMDQLEHQSDHIHINWFMNGTNNDSYQMANEILHAYQVRAIDIV